MSVRRVWISLFVCSFLAGPLDLPRLVIAQDHQNPASQASRNTGSSWTSSFQLATEWLPFKQPAKNARRLPSVPETTQQQAPQRIETVPGMLAMARMVERQGDLAKAEGMYRGILATDPKHPVALHRLGVITARQSNYKLAAAILEKALKFSPRNAELLADLGNTYYQLEQPEESEKHLRQALHLNPNDDVARNNLAMVLAVQHRSDEALAEFRKVGTEAEAHANLSFVLRQIGQVDAANEHYETAMSMNRTLRRTVGALVWTREPTNDSPAIVQRRPTPRPPAVKPSKTRSLVRHSRRPPPDPAPKPPATTAVAKASPATSGPSRTALIPRKSAVGSTSTPPRPSGVASKPSRPPQTDVATRVKKPVTKPSTQVQSPDVAYRNLVRRATKPKASSFSAARLKYPTTSSSQPSTDALITKNLTVLNATPKKAVSKKEVGPSMALSRTRQQAPPATTRRPIPRPATKQAAGRPPAQLARSSGARSSGSRSSRGLSSRGLGSRGLGSRGLGSRGLGSRGLAPVVDASSYRKPFDAAAASGVSIRTANIQDGDSSEAQDTWLAAYRTLVKKAAASGATTANATTGD